MRFKFLLFIVLACLLCLSSQAQEKRIIVCTESDAEVYKKWAKRDAAYLITKEEKEAYEKLITSAEREKFIEDFWRRRDPTPATEVNEFRTEHYERIAYTNEHFASGIPGWMTDRGRTYIVYGKPDRIEKGRAKFENFENILFETWHYKSLKGVGTGVEVTFIDPTETNEYRIRKHSKAELEKYKCSECGSL